MHTSASCGRCILGLGPTSIGFVGWAYALARTDAGRLGSSTYLVPPLASDRMARAVGEVPPLLTLPGGILSLVGVAIARRRAHPATRRAPAPELLAAPQSDLAASS